MSQPFSNNNTIQPKKVQFTNSEQKQQQQLPQNTSTSFNDQLRQQIPEQNGGIISHAIILEKRENDVTQINDDDLAHAVIYILSAFTKHFHGTVRCTKTARLAHFWGWKLNSFFSFLMFILVGLTFFEPPLWCVQRGSPGGCQSPSGNYPFFGVPIITPLFSHIIEFICIFGLWIKLILQLISSGKQIFKLQQVVIRWIIIIITTIDFLYACIMRNQIFRLGAYLRILMFVFHYQKVRKEFWMIIRTIRNFHVVIFITFLIIGFFSFVGTLMFNNMHEQNDYFRDFQTSLWSLFVLMTTSNYPDLTVRALDSNRLYFFYFLIYVILIVFFLTNLLTAIVYEMYQEKVRFEYTDENKRKKWALNQAWNFLDPAKKGFLTFSEFTKLIKEMNKYRQFRKYIDINNIDLFFCALDVNDTGQIEEEEFHQIVHVLKLKFEQLDGPIFVQLWFPNFSRKKLYQCIRFIVQSKFFEYFIDILLVIMAVVTFFETWALLQKNHDTENHYINQYAKKFGWHCIEVIFTNIFIFEAFLRIFGMGWKKYWRAHCFDFFVMIASIMTTSTLFIPLKFVEKFSQQKTQILTFFLKFFYYCQVMQIPGLLRLLRMIVTVSWFKIFYVTFISMIRPAKKLLLVLFCFMYFFSILGMNLFGGLVSRDSEILKKTNYGINDYYSINMNDMMSSMTLMLELLVTNNFQVFVDAYVQLTGTAWTRLFFVFFYIIGDVICLNLVLSTIITIFTHEFGRGFFSMSDDDIQPSEQIQVYGSKVFFRAVSSSYNGRFRATFRGHYDEQEDSEDLMRNLFKNKSGHNFLGQLDNQDLLTEPLLVEEEKQPQQS